MQSFGTLQQPPLVDLAESPVREIMPSIMATSLRWRTHSARTNIYALLKKIFGHIQHR